MVVTIAEAAEKRAEAEREYARNGVLKQWYYCLGQALKKQEERQAVRPVFGREFHFLIGYSEGFILEVIGDELAELGLAIVTGYVSNGFETAERRYILYPEESYLIR